MIKFKGIHDKFIQKIVVEISGDIMEINILEIKVKNLKLKVDSVLKRK